MARDETRKCEVCGGTKETRKVRTVNRVLCGKHRQQIGLKNRIYESYKEPQKIIELDSHIEMELKNIKSEVIGYMKIDKEDYLKIKDFRVYTTRQTSGIFSSCVFDGIEKRIKVHRFITNCPEGLVVDHINHDTTDNRRCNLRIVPQWVNALNKGKEGIGVTFRKREKRWVATLKLNKKVFYSKLFKNYQEALEARKDLERKYYEPIFKQYKALG